MSTGYTLACLLFYCSIELIRYIDIIGIVINIIVFADEGYYPYKCENVDTVYVCNNINYFPTLIACDPLKQSNMYFSPLDLLVVEDILK